MEIDRVCWHKKILSGLEVERPAEEQGATVVTAIST